MLKKQYKWKSLLSFFVILSILVSLFSGFTLIAYATGSTGSCENGYVTNINICKSSANNENIPGFTFDRNVTTYNVDLYNAVTPIIRFDVSDAKDKDGNNLYYSFDINGTTVGTKIITKTSLAVAGNLTSKILLNSTCGENTFSLKVGSTTDAGKTFTSFDEYIFCYYLRPVLGTLQLNDGENEIALTPEYKGGVYYNTDTFSATSSAETIILSGKYRNDHTSCYIGASTEALATTVSGTNASFSTEITTADYWDATTAMSVIPIRLVYENGETKIETKQYVYIANAGITGSNYKPTIEQQPQNIACEKEETPSLSVSASAPNDAELTYQWYCGTSDSNLKQISETIRVQRFFIRLKLIIWDEIHISRC